MKTNYNDIYLIDLLDYLSPDELITAVSKWLPRDQEKELIEDLNSDYDLELFEEEE